MQTWPLGVVHLVVSLLLPLNKRLLSWDFDARFALEISMRAFDHELSILCSSLIPSLFPVRIIQLKHTLPHIRPEYSVDTGKQRESIIAVNQAEPF